MIDFWAVMLDETGCEFGVGVLAASRPEALDKLREGYPESRCVQLESPADRRAREQDLVLDEDEFEDYEEDY